MWLLRVLRDETRGGALMLGAAALAFMWANSSGSSLYESIITTPVAGMELRTWASDGLLALFFFIVGLELKHEFAVGTLSDPRKAIVPIVAAVCGMAVPAALFLLVTDNSDGWAIPMATDIAFALAVLAVVGRGLPLAVRAFLLTLAVVDDLGAILVIALFFSKGFSLQPFLIFVAACAAWWLLQRVKAHGALFVPLFLIGWWFLHESGVHATVAGVAFGLLTALHRVDTYDAIWRPVVVGLAVPIFAFTAAGVSIEDSSVLLQPVTIAIIVGLVIGKPLGTVGGSWLITRLTTARLDDSIAWRHVVGVGILAGIGFTVSLLIAELAYGKTEFIAEAKMGVLVASVLATAAAALFLGLPRSRAATLDS